MENATNDGAVAADEPWQRSLDPILQKNPEPITKPTRIGVVLDVDADGNQVSATIVAAFDRSGLILMEVQDANA